MSQLNQNAEFPEMFFYTSFNYFFPLNTVKGELLKASTQISS